MSIFRVYVDGQIFYHPHLSKLAITEATGKRYHKYGTDNLR